MVSLDPPSRLQPAKRGGEERGKKVAQEGRRGEGREERGRRGEGRGGEGRRRCSSGGWLMQGNVKTASAKV